MASSAAAALASGSVAVRLEGDISPQCAIEAADFSGPTLGIPIQFGDVSQAGRFDYGFTVNCNAPFIYKVEAQNGALMHEDGRAVPGFTTAVPYQVAMHIPTKTRVISESCAGSGIRMGSASCGFGDSGGDIALGAQSSLTISWPSSGTAPLAGKFEDRLSITVAVQH